MRDPGPIGGAAIAVPPSRRTTGEVRPMIALALPLVLSQLATIAIGTTDIVMMGWLGPEKLAGGALGHNLFFPLFLFGLGVLTAVSPLASAGHRRRRPARCAAFRAAGLLGCRRHRRTLLRGDLAGGDDSSVPGAGGGDLRAGRRVPAGCPLGSDSGVLGRGLALLRLSPLAAPRGSRGDAAGCRGQRAGQLPIDVRQVPAFRAWNWWVRGSAAASCTASCSRR